MSCVNTSKTTAIRNPDYPRYKRLPTVWDENRGHWFYGWAVTDEIIRKYLQKYYPHDVSEASWLLNSNGLYDLKQYSGYRHLAFVGGKPDAESIKQGRVIQLERGLTLYVIAVSSTRSDYLYRRRPTVAQLAMLTEIFEEEPRWIEGFEDKANFNDDWMH
ncbi:hypothetical protein BDN70DRAFT_991663 [Pholiota conissans]|uniref:Uncharacterized protein n=1 Tax=Pholiota conissans TaxID=109636 RepID=A0A9P6D3M6_9AGAR|nr:hypothetical protein BDN70DRAFT_991663 [Pholiota conissans]